MFPLPILVSIFSWHLYEVCQWMSTIIHTQDVMKLAKKNENVEALLF